MIGGLPGNTGLGIGAATLHTVEAVAVLSALCALGAGICLVLARRSRGIPARVLRWLALLLAVAALGPPLFLVTAAGR